jgi:hypothetical protein
MATLVPPTFDDYYDLSSEEEALLSDLASKIVPAPASTRESSTTTSTISRGDTSAGSLVAGNNVTQRYGSTNASVARTAAADFGYLPTPPSGPQPGSQTQTESVVYPDCGCCPSSGPQGLKISFG